MRNLTLTLLLIYSGLASTAGFETEIGTRKFSDKLVNQIFKEKFQIAFNSAKPYWPIPVVEIDGIVNKINHIFITK